MSQPILDQPFVPLAVRDNRIFFILPVHPGASLPERWTLLEAFKDHHQAASLIHRLAPRSVHSSRELPAVRWNHPEQGLLVADELLPDVVGALGRHRDGKSVDWVELSPSGLNLLNGVYAPPGTDPRAWSEAERKALNPSNRGLRIALSDVAKARLGTAAEEIIVFLYRVIAVAPSSVALLIAEFEVKPSGPGSVTTGEIQEALHILSNRKRSASCGFATITGSTNLDIQELLFCLLPPALVPASERTRAFTYTVAVPDAFPSTDEAITHEAYRFARRYTFSYALRSEEVAKVCYRPFASVIHCFALEGAATLFDGSDLFLGEQAMTRVRQSYLWLVALACHESAHLQLLLSADLRHSLQDKTQGPAARQLIRRFLNFRQKHHIPLVSNIEMHHQVFERLREKLQVHSMIGKMTGDVIEAERWFKLEAEEGLAKERDRRKRTRHKIAPIEACIAAVLMGSLTFLAFDALTRKIWQIEWHIEPSPNAGLWIPLVAGVIAFFFRGFQVWYSIYEEPLEDSLVERGADQGDETDHAGVGAAVGGEHH